MLKKIKPKGLTPLKLVNALMLLAPALAVADTAYRCGDAYGPSAQCANGPATPVKPTAELRTTGPTPANTAAHDLREAQALEKQRLLAEQRAAQQALLQPVANTPVPLNAVKAGNAKKTASPYFTAVDPTAHPKKKSATQP